MSSKSSKVNKTKSQVSVFDQGSNIEKRYIGDYKKLDKVITDLKSKGHKIVLTQGVWDLIHEGHAKYLEVARSYGDILVVGADSDALTKQRKGPNRPIVPQGERLNMLVHLRSVDIVTLRNIGEDIGDLIRLVKPDVYVASQTTKDFTKQLVKTYKPYCKKIVILPAQATTTSTARIRNLTIEGAEKLARVIQKNVDDFLEKIRTA